MTRARKAASNKRRSTTRTTARSSNRLVRFLRAFVVTGIAGFGLGTYLLSPQWQPPSQWEWSSEWRLPSSADQAWSRLAQWLPGQRAQEPSAAPVRVSGPSVQTLFTACPQFFPGQHAPIVPAAQRMRELCFSGFAVLHSGETKTPLFVAERLNRQLLTQAQGLQRTDKFYAEARLPSAERAELADYRGSGYSRGHLAPAANMTSAEAMAQSFSLANMVPQDQTHNGGPWNRIEQDTRKYIMRATGDVYIFTGAVFDGAPKTIGQGVAVPSHMYKLVYDAATGKSWAHWQANDAATRVSAPISYDELVRRTGIEFLPASSF